METDFIFPSGKQNICTNIKTIVTYNESINMRFENNRIIEGS